MILGLPDRELGSREISAIVPIIAESGISAGPMLSSRTTRRRERRNFVLG